MKQSNQEKDNERKQGLTLNEYLSIELPPTAWRVILFVMIALLIIQYYLGY